MEATPMIAFETKAAMEIKFATTVAMAETQIAGGRLDQAFDVAILTARAQSKYVPQIYRGGYVIPQFGYSTERIGKYVTPEEAGDPSLVTGRWVNLNG
jgi:hypothetical protein